MLALFFSACSLEFSMQDGFTAYVIGGPHIPEGGGGFIPREIGTPGGPISLGWGDG